MDMNRNSAAEHFIKGSDKIKENLNINRIYLYDKIFCKEFKRCRTVFYESFNNLRHMKWGEMIMIY